MSACPLARPPAYPCLSTSTHRDRMRFASVNVYASVCVCVRRYLATRSHTYTHTHTFARLLHKTKEKKTRIVSRSLRAGSALLPRRHALGLQSQRTFGSEPSPSVGFFSFHAVRIPPSRHPSPCYFFPSDAPIENTTSLAPSPRRRIHRAPTPDHRDYPRPAVAISFLRRNKNKRIIQKPI